MGSWDLLARQATLYHPTNPNTSHTQNSHTFSHTDELEQHHHFSASSPQSPTLPRKEKTDLNSIFERIKSVKKLQMANIFRILQIWRDNTHNISTSQHYFSLLCLSSCHFESRSLFSTLPLFSLWGTVQPLKCLSPYWDKGTTSRWLV